MKESFKTIIKKTYIGTVLINFYKNYLISTPQRSYSQAGEDLILDFFLKKQKRGFYVDIGAYHPKYLSNTYKFYKRGWTGIQIEPNKDRAKLFEKSRPNTTTLSVGIMPTEGDRDFYIFDADTLCTFSKESAESNQLLGHKLLEIRRVQTLPLVKVFSDYISQKIDILSIDVEGYDLEVLKTNDWENFRPHFIITETLEYSLDMSGKKMNIHYDTYMESIGYEKIADTYLNTIYVDKFFRNK